MRAHLLYYRIPKVRLSRRGRMVEADVFPNPSPILRRIGYRVDGSVWVVPTDLLPYSLINAMRDTTGVIENHVEFSQEEAKNLVETARATIAQSVVDAVNTVSAADGAAYNQDDWSSLEEFEKHRASKVKAAARKATKLIRDFASAGEGFGLSADDLNLDTANSHIHVIQTIAHNRAKAYVRGAKRLRAVGSSLADAADKDRLPPAQMADLLRDHGDDEGADEIQEAFTEAA